MEDLDIGKLTKDLSKLVLISVAVAVSINLAYLAFRMIETRYPKKAYIENINFASILKSYDTNHNGITTIEEILKCTDDELNVKKIKDKNFRELSYAFIGGLRYDFVLPDDSTQTLLIQRDNYKDEVIINGK